MILVDDQSSAFAVDRARSLILRQWHLNMFRSNTALFRFSRLRVLLGVVAIGITCSVQAGPPFPWRPRTLGPAPSTQPQNFPAQPRTRSVVPSASSAPQDRSIRPQPLVSPEPTPVDSPPVTTPAGRTYFTAKRPAALFPSGHGIHVAVSEKFLDELIRVESLEAGPVRDCILGAQVVGSQQTETSLHVRLIPSDDVAQLEFQLSGTTRNSTENRTRQAVIQSEGTHRFEVSKSVQFNGQQVLTRSPSATLFPNQRNRSALTPASAIPILGPLVSEFALGVAEQSRPASERITAQRITQQVVPQFNQAFDKRLAVLNTQLRDVLPRQLPLLGITQPTTRVRTTDQQLTVSFSWETTQNCPEYLPPVTTLDAAELRIAVHSEAVNIWLASLPLAGLEIPLSDLDRWKQELERVLSLQEPGRSEMPVFSRFGQIRTQPVGQEELLPGLGSPTILGPMLAPPSEPLGSMKVNKVPSDAQPEPTPLLGNVVEPLDSQTRMILSQTTPITVEFRSGEAIITLVAAFRIASAPQTDDHRIRIPIKSQLTPSGLAVTPGTVRVETTSTSPGLLSEVMRSTIEKQVQQRLQPTQWPIQRPIEREQGAPVTLRLQELSSDSGWLSLVWNVEAGVNASEPMGSLKIQ